MKLKSHFIFWVVAYVFFVLMYKNAFDSYRLSLYFVSLLFPVALGTSVTFNYYLVPTYLIPKKTSKFFLHFTYLIIGSAYLELVVIFLSFIFLAEMKIDNMHPIILDVSNMVIMIYVVVFAHGFFLTMKKYQNNEKLILLMTEEKEKSQMKYLNIKSDRKNVRINLEKILYLESLSDYIKIHRVDGEPIISKQKISSFHAELPASFLRIHRSFIINTKHMNSFSSDTIILGDEKLTIGRTYKKGVFSVLNSEN